MNIYCYRFHINDWRGPTSNLSLQEKGVYLEMINSYYLSGGSLPNNVSEISRMIGAQTKGEKKAIAKIINAKKLDEDGNLVPAFFEVKNHFLFQIRASEEISKIQDKSKKASQSAASRYNDNNDIDEANVGANAVRTQCERSANHKPITNNHKNKKEEVGGTAQAPPPPTTTDFIKPPDFEGDENATSIPTQAIVRLSPRFALPEEWGLYAEKLGFLPDEIIREAEKFKEYWLNGRGAGKRRNLRNWRQSWANWIAKAANERRAA